MVGGNWRPARGERLQSPRVRRLEEALFNGSEPPRGARRLIFVPILVILALALSAPASAAPTPQPYGTHDAGGFRNVLPNGQGSNANALQIAAYQATQAYPPHSQDQLHMYFDLVDAVGAHQGLRRSQIPDYYKDATFGVKPGDVVSTYSPRADVTIVRDSFGVPHIYGSDREGTMFGAGYAGAEDRLFQMDVIRHLGRGQLSSFAGGSNAGMDEGTWAYAPYNESELQEQYDRADELYGAKGARLQEDAQSYVDGVNKFISEACINQLKLPGEYGLINPAQNICLQGHGWKVADVIATASVIAGRLGTGGGGEVGNAITLQAAKKRFGRRAGSRVFADLSSAHEREAPTTAHRPFPYAQVPKHRRGLAMPDRGSVVFADDTKPGGLGKKSSTRAPAPSAPGATSGRFTDLARPLLEHRSASNALLVSGRETKSGRPIAVIGPQVAYWSPEILMEEDIHAPSTAQGPGIDARGATFPGTNLYVELGRGRNYAWSATSAGQDITDTYAVKLCDPNGGTPTLSSDHYVYNGQCLPFDVLTRTNSWTPTPADQSGPGSETLTTLRSKLGLVTARATIHGKPYAFTELRADYFHEVDPSALGFANFNDPKRMSTPKRFMNSACKIAFTFHWFYINRHHIAYFNSGANPVRPRGVDSHLPVFGKKKFVWRNHDPEEATQAQAKCSAHPHVVDQRYLTSWNNRGARRYDTGYSPIFRSQTLDERIRPDIRGRRKINLQQLISDMEDAGTADLRGDRVVPWLVRVLRKRPIHNSAARHAVHMLAAWHRSGAHRRDLNHDGVYEDEDAARLMDVWWPRLVEAQFKPALGSNLYGLVAGKLADDDDRPGGLGSAFDTSAYGIVQKDLRDLLGAHVRGRYSRVYCGKGRLGRCRAALLGSLKDALSAIQQGAESDTCTLGANGHTAHGPACYDAIRFTALGGIGQPDMPWINRPTFQQTVQVGK